jgi:hypothetical protein
MKKLMILGGLLGFLIGATLGIAQECEPATIVWRSSVAAAVTGLLFRWWGGLWVQGFRASYLRKLEAETESAPAGSVAPAKQ